jgi:GNAT superfamily N-acetyltransferase
VRLATRSDFKFLLKMPPYSKIVLDDLLRREEVLVAENNGVVFGAVSIGHQDILYSPEGWSDEVERHLINLAEKISDGWISKLYVFPEYRCHGIATILVKEALSLLKGTKIAEAYAGINVKNEFRKFSEDAFESNGFKRVGSCICFLTQGKCRGTLLKKHLDLESKRKN